LFDGLLRSGQDVACPGDVRGGFIEPVAEAIEKFVGSIGLQRLRGRGDEQLLAAAA
jgi:hypothetical protein